MSNYEDDRYYGDSDTIRSDIQRLLARLPDILADSESNVRVSKISPALVGDNPPTGWNKRDLREFLLFEPYQQLYDAIVRCGWEPYLQTLPLTAEYRLDYILWARRLRSDRHVVPSTSSAGRGDEVTSL